MQIVDRPWPTRHEHKSVNFIVDFAWGSPASQIPISGQVQIEAEPKKMLVINPSAPWKSLESAINDVISQTKEIIDAGAPQ